MLDQNEIKHKSESLIELLTAQCADLEKLLDLARAETDAAKSGNFLGVLDIVSDREIIGKKLETYHRQISELRSALGENAETYRRNEIAKRVVEIANLTIEQDQFTHKLLCAARQDSKETLERSASRDRGHRAYLSAPTKGLAYEGNF